MTATRFEELIRLLVERDIEFVLVGGLAATVHGSSYVTYDVDVSYGRATVNVERVCRALAPIHPTLRGAPKDLPFHFDPPAVAAGLNFTLATDLGALDLIGEMQPFGAYEHVVEHSEQIDLFGHPVRVLKLEALIEAKRAAGRRKDLLVIPELEALLELRKRDEE